MNIPLKMNPDFEKAMHAMDEKYGEDFQILNGFHESQLNFSDFIDNFIDKNVADATIDANANASNKDIRSMLNEKTKPHDKLFAFNKIFCGHCRYCAYKRRTFPNLCYFHCLLCF